MEGTLLDSELSKSNIKTTEFCIKLSVFVCVMQESKQKKKDFQKKDAVVQSYAGPSQALFLRHTYNVKD